MGSLGSPLINNKLLSGPCRQKSEDAKSLIVSLDRSSRSEIPEAERSQRKTSESEPGNIFRVGIHLKISTSAQLLPLLLLPTYLTLPA
jgi:hypothetical protein